jgi:hypothetical protein
MKQNPVSQRILLLCACAALKLGTEMQTRDE